MNKIKKVGAIIGFALIGIFAAVGAINHIAKDNTQMVFAETATITNVTLEDAYMYGDALDLPAVGKFAYKGKEYTAEKAYLVYPNGRYCAGTQFSLNEYGVYTVVMEGTVDGESVVAEDTFTVNKEYYTVGLSGSNIGYGDLNASFRAKGYYTGLKIGLAEGDTFTYHQPINIYETDVKDVISLNCLQFSPVVKYLTVRLTDCYDPSIYIDITCKKYNYDYETYIVAGANGQKAVGLVKNDNGAISVDGTKYKVSNDGTWISGNNTSNQSYVNFTYALGTTDKKNIKIYVNTPSGSTNDLVSELNNELIYDYSFDGFTNGNVYLSVSAATLVGVATAEVEIAHIMQTRGKDLLPTDYCRDNTAPIFKVDAPEGRKDVVVGIPLTVPKAMALDDTGICGEMDYSVWYNYHSNAPKMVCVTDGTFIPNKLGVYTVVYCAKDVFGNEGNYTLDLYAVKESEKGIEFDCTIYENVTAGSKLKFDDYTLQSLSGNEKLYVEITKPNGEKERLKAPSDNYLFDTVGKYTVTYYYSDSFYSESYSYTITSVDSGLPSFISEEVFLPNYFIKGATYSVEKVYAYRYTETGINKTEVKAYICFDNGEYTPCDVTSVTISGEKTVQIKFVCADAESVFIESDIVPIVDVGYTGTLQIEKYFQGDFIGQNDAEKDYTTYSTSVVGNANMYFVNSIIASNFLLDYQIPSSDSIASMEIVMTDFYNRANELRIVLKNQGKNGTISVNNSPEINLQSGWLGKRCSLSYYGDLLTIGTTQMTIENPFESDVCLLKVHFNGVRAGDEFRLYQLCNQRFGNITRDFVQPMIAVQNVERVGIIGDTVVLPRPYAADVLSPSSMNNLTMTVYKNGKVMSATDGTLLKDIIDFQKEYVIRYDEYASYLIVYKYIDGKGKQVDARMPITVADNIRPEIVLNNYNGTPATAKVGQNIKPLDYTVTDNMTKAEDIVVWCVVENEKGIMITATQDTFTLTKAGKYKVHLYCYDEKGNSNFVSYELIVKNGDK